MIVIRNSFNVHPSTISVLLVLLQSFRPDRVILANEQEAVCVCVCVNRIRTQPDKINVLCHKTVIFNIQYR